METLEFIKDYKNSPKLRLSFNQLAMETFGQAIDFESWYQNGYWNDCYKCYSFVEGDRVVANISVNDMTLVVDGQESKILQIGTVMTHPDYRKRGLATKLMQAVQKDYEDQVECIYLFGNDAAKNLYMSWGFQAVNEVNYTMDANKLHPKNGVLKRLDLTGDEDLNFLKERAINRHAVSHRFGVVNDVHLLMFYCSKFMGETLYYVEGEDVIVSYEIEEGVLHLYEVISQNGFDLETLLSQLLTSDTKKVVFYFTPDMATDLIDQSVLVVEDQTLLVMPKLPWNDRAFRFPFFSHA